MEQIVLATGNKGKIREFSEAFSHLSIDCVPVKAVTVSYTHLKVVLHVLES